MHRLFGLAGVVLAVCGTGMTAVTGNVMYDGIASLCISAVLAAVSLKLVALNHGFILGRVSLRLIGRVCWFA